MNKDWVCNREQISWENKYSWNIIFQRSTFRTFTKVCWLFIFWVDKVVVPKGVTFVLWVLFYSAWSHEISTSSCNTKSLFTCAPKTARYLRNIGAVSVVSFLGWVDLKHATQSCLYTVYEHTFPSGWWTCIYLLQLSVCPVSFCGKVLIFI